MKNKSFIQDLINDIQKTRKILNENSLLRDQNDYETNVEANQILNISYKKIYGKKNFLFDVNLNYSDLINKLLEQRDFCFLLYDKSIIQYEFKIQNNDVIKERLVFIKKHNKLWKRTEIENLDSTSDEWFDDNFGLPIVLRIDYDEENYKPLVHPKIHLTLSNHEACRIPVKTFIPISDFMQFILYNFYDIDLKLSNTFNFPSFLSLEEKKIFHIDW